MGKPVVDPRILALCKKVTRTRARRVVDHLLKHGYITTEELQELYNYDHPPRAARDVREEGIPLETFRVESKRTGRKIGAYRFADPGEIKHGRIGGRKAFSKAFKEALVERFGARDALTSQLIEARYLQIDHRVPYEVAGDSVHDENDLGAYMLLDGSSQRAKSWSCEHCENWTKIRNADICRRCYWAFPEDYDHVAMTPIRRLTVEWRGDEVKSFDAFARSAKAAGLSLVDYLKTKLVG